jgi:hypothetical protein
MKGLGFGPGRRRQERVMGNVYGITARKTYGVAHLF